MIISFFGYVFGYNEYAKQNLFAALNNYINIFDEGEQNFWVIDCLFVFAILNIRENNYEKAKLFSQKALNIALRIEKTQKGFNNRIMYGQLNLANYYKQKKNLKNTEKYFQLALKTLLCSPFEDNETLGDVFYSLGKFYKVTNQIKESQEYLLNSIKQYELKFGENTPKMIDISKELGELYFKERNFNEAIRYFEKALILAKKMSFNYEIFEIYEILISLCDESQDFHKKEIYLAEIKLIEKIYEIE